MAATPQYQDKDPQLWVRLTLIRATRLFLTFHVLIDVFGCSLAKTSLAKASKLLTTLGTAAPLSTCALLCLFHLRHCCLDRFVFDSPLWCWGHKSNTIEGNSQFCLPTNEPLAPSVEPAYLGTPYGYFATNCWIITFVFALALIFSRCGRVGEHVKSVSRRISCSHCVNTTRTWASF